MSVQEIEQAVSSLPPADLAEFSQWFEEFQSQMWDEQIARDARSGRLDALIQRAKEQAEAGQCHALGVGSSLTP